MDKYFKWKVALIFAVLGLSIFFAYPPNEKINLGLDLQGGMHLLLHVELDKIPAELSGIARFLALSQCPTEEHTMRRSLRWKDSWIPCALN